MPHQLLVARRYREEKKRDSRFERREHAGQHLAALAKVRTVGLFGPSSIEKYHPWGKKTLHISGDKSPDDLMGHKNFDFRQEDCLMEDLKVDYVLKKIIQFYR